MACPLWSFKTQTPVFAAVVLAIFLAVAVLDMAPAAQGTVYTVNGLTCSIPSDYLSFRAVVYLVPLVTGAPQFLSLASGQPYMFGNAENLTDRTQRIGGGPVQHLPDALEMVFYTFGQGTGCGESESLENPWLNTIVVDVPIEGSGFNTTGATFNSGGGGPV